MLHIEVGQQVLLEQVMYRASVGDVVQGFESQMPSTESGGETAGHHAQITPQGFGDHGQAIAPTPQCLPQRVQSRFPAHGHEFSGASGAGTAHGPGNPVRVVHRLEAGFAACALFSLVGGI